MNSRNMKIPLTDNYLMTKHNNFPKNCIKKLMNSSLIHSENAFPQEFNQYCKLLLSCKYFWANQYQCWGEGEWRIRTITSSCSKDWMLGCDWERKPVAEKEHSSSGRCYDISGVHLSYSPAQGKLKNAALFTLNTLYTILRL